MIAFASTAFTGLGFRAIALGVLRLMIRHGILTQRGTDMIDHITFGVTDFARSTAFYDAAFAPLTVTRLFDVPVEHTNGILVTGYRDVRPWFWIAQDNATTGTLHIALSATSRNEVDAFYAAAIKAGGTDNGAPGLRPHYHGDYYGAFVLDPDGHNIEAVCHMPQNPA